MSGQIRWRIGVEKRWLLKAQQDALGLLKEYDYESMDDDALLNLHRGLYDTRKRLLKHHSKMKASASEWRILVRENMEEKTALYNYVTQYGNFMKDMKQAAATMTQLSDMLDVTEKLLKDRGIEPDLVSEGSTISNVALSQLTSNLLFQVLRRMENQSLCRLRRTCRSMDKFAEDNRFKIATRREDTDWVLLIQKKSENSDDLYFSIRNSFLDYGDEEWMFGTPEEDEEDKEEGDAAVISDPFKQLSAISIRGVLLFSTNCVPGCHHLTADLPEFLSRLQLRVDWLCLFCYYTPELLESVDFLRLRIENEDVEPSIPMEIQNCKEVALRNEVFQFSCCRPLFPLIETLSIEFNNRTKCAEFINQMITMPLDENLLLKLLRITYYFGDDQGDFKFTDVQPLYHIQITDIHYMEFYKIPVHGGFAIIAHGVLSVTYVEIHLVREDSRQSLLNVLWRYLSPIPPNDYDVADFVAAESEQDAFDDFYELTKHLIHFVRSALKPTLISETSDLTAITSNDTPYDLL